ncbi:Uncharacterized protein Rs2_02616 [Raphanus sativus]|nr:Uncharacterized protein Rs2_02616 [Raphanus sativus]
METIGMANVRSLICEGSDIPPFPDEVDDFEVGNLLALIREDFPFELNTWRGGVKATDARQGRGVGGRSGIEGEDGVADDRNDTTQNLNNPQRDGRDVDRIARAAADAVVAQAMPMFEGYAVNIKSHVLREISMFKETIGGEMKLVNRELGEFRKLLIPQSAGRTTMYQETRRASPRSRDGDGETSNPPNVSDELREDATAGCGNQGIVNDDGTPTETEAAQQGNGGDGTSGKEKATDVLSDCLHPDDAVNMVLDSLRVEGDVEPEGISREEVSPVRSAETEVAPSADISTDPLPEEVTPTKVAPSPDIPTQAVQQDVTPIEPVTDVCDQEANPTEVDIASLNEQHRESACVDATGETPQTPMAGCLGSSSSQLDQRNIGADVVGEQPQQPEVTNHEKRVSKRPRIATVRYTPEEDAAKKVKGNQKKKKNVAPRGKGRKTKEENIVETGNVPVADNNPPPFLTTAGPIGPLIGGFSPVPGLNGFRLAAFTTHIILQRDYTLGNGLVVPNTVFRDFFQSLSPQTVQAADMVVSFIRKRVRDAGVTTYDFLPASFLISLRLEYGQFSLVNDIAKFSFSSCFGKDGMPAMRWESSVNVLYCPFQLDGRHWVGVVIDIEQWSVTILDCNSVVVPVERMEENLQPLIQLFPYLLPLYGCAPKMEGGIVAPLSVMRVEPPMLAEPTGLSCVASLLLLELHATGSMHQAASLNVDVLSVAAKSYAVAALEAFYPNVIP